MAVIDPNLIKFFQCQTWAEGDTHGGPPSTNQITTGQLENVFDHVQPDEKPSTEYRKVWVKNENVDDWLSVVAWISQLTAWNEDEFDINVDQATWTDTQADAVSYTYYRPTARDHVDANKLNVYDASGVLQNSTGDIGQNEYAPIWIRRTVNTTTEGYSNNNGIIALGTQS